MARPRRIDRQAVLQASLDLADRGGINAVTMQSVATALGVTPMALYRHVNGKEDLLAGLVEALLDQLPNPATGVQPLEALTTLGRALRAVARRHPAVFPLLLQLPATTPAAVKVRNRVRTHLRELGIGRGRAERFERLITTMILGFAASEASGRFAAHSSATLDADFAALESMIEAWITAAAST